MDSDKNIYKEEINFADLASQDPDFAKILKSNGQVDFSNPESVLQLTKSLLKRDFGLQISLPPDRLCPPVPNRLNYLLWIQELLDSTSDTFSDRHDPNREVVGLDIGTGASCIYPLLGCSTWPKWTFAATDIDDLSLQYARRNINQNHLQDRIKLLRSSTTGPLTPLQALALDSLTFTMCNPPFYTSKAEMLHSASLKGRPPFTACTGSANEMVVAGGEVAFVSRMIDESVKLREQVQWYTSMLGKLSSIEEVVGKLREVGVDNYAVTEFVQGNKTRRWGVAWSWGDLRPKTKVARGVGNLARNLLPFPADYVITLQGESAKLLEDVGKRINDTLEELPLQWKWKQAIWTGVGFAAKNVWSRAARRKSAKAATSDRKQESSEEEDDMAFGFKMNLEKVADPQEGLQVTIRWLKGYDSVLFESFCGMIKRKIEN